MFSIPKVIDTVAEIVAGFAMLRALVRNTNFAVAARRNVELRGLNQCTTDRAIETAVVDVAEPVTGYDWGMRARGVDRLEGRRHSESWNR